MDNNRHYDISNGSTLQSNNSFSGNNSPFVNRANSKAASSGQLKIIDLFRDIEKSDNNFMQKLQNMTLLQNPTASHDEKPNFRSSYKPNDTSSISPQRQSINKIKSYPNINIQDYIQSSMLSNLNKIYRSSAKDLTTLNENENTQLQTYIKKIYDYYTDNQLGINRDMIHKFAKDTLLDQIISDKTLDMLFRKYTQSQNALQFGQFINVIIDCAIIISPDSPREESFKQLFQVYILPLYKRIFQKSKPQEFEALLKAPIQEGTISLLRVIAPAFLTIHHHFFPSEYQNLTKSEVETKCESHMQHFLREFNVCPQLVSFGVAHSVFKEIANIDPKMHPDITLRSTELLDSQGTSFTLTKLLIFVLRLALAWGWQLSHENLIGQNTQINQQDIVLLLLEKMEASKGFENLRKTLGIANYLTFTILPKKQIHKVNHTP